MTRSAVPEEYVEFVATNPTAPDSGPRRTLLTTRIVKKEFGRASKRNVSSFDSPVEAIPLSRFKSRSMMTVPLATMSLSMVCVAVCELFSGDDGAEFPELSVCNNNSGSAK